MTNSEVSNYLKDVDYYERLVLSADDVQWAAVYAQMATAVATAALAAATKDKS